MSNRKKITLLVLPLTVIVILLSLSCSNKVAISNNRTGDHTGSIVWDGLKRTYLVHIPPSYGRTKSISIPLVIALHGGGGSAKDMVKLTKGGLSALADKEGFIVIYPDGIEKNWNDGREDEDKDSAHRENIDDVGFISALIDHFAKELNIDKRRVYVTGMSNGAMMSHRLACELSEKISAIAMVAGAISKNKTYTCLPSRPLSVLIIHGTDDPLVPWEGGEIRGGHGTVLSTYETVEFWITHNKCSSSPIITWEPDKDDKDGTRVWKEVYGNCREESEVILYGIEGGGHTWPGGRSHLPERIVGKTSRDIDANEVIWNFFTRHIK